MFPLLFLDNDWADCVEILYALGNPLVTAYAVVTDGESLHVRTCTPRFCISQTARPIEFNFGVRVQGHELGVHVMGGVSLHVRTCAPRFCMSGTAQPTVFKFGMWVGGH